MTLTTIDFLIIALYFVLTLGIGFWFRSRASKDISEYFISGRSLPWWIAGTSMVATTFAADTPLAVTGLTIQDGMAGNWVWWAFALGGMITVFVYAKLWRRAGVMTDVELVEMRYAGKPAAILRGTRAIYVALIVNPIIIGWVTKAMITVLNETILFDPIAAAELAELVAQSPNGEIPVQPIPMMTWVIIVGTLSLVAVYGMLSGMWGVAITDSIQFCFAMFGCIALAYLAIDHFGGATELEAQVIANFGEEGAAAFNFIPDLTGSNAWMPVYAFLIMLLVQWWATWYPGAEPGGGGYVVQRMAACKDERHSLLATLWYQIAHYCVRPWPWLIVAFAALAMFPELRAGELANPDFDSGVGFPRVMRALSGEMGYGLRGLLVVTFLAAFMSTLSTQMNWGASYLVRDVYQRFVKPDATNRELTIASRWLSMLVLVGGGVATVMMINVSIDAAWKILLALGAGTGAVFMLRWFWWRINAWTEIASMVASLLFFTILSLYSEDIAQAVGLEQDFRDEVKMLLVAVASIVVWLGVTFMTAPELPETLDNFYRKVRPGGVFWGPVAKRNPSVNVDQNVGLSIVAALCSAGIVYSVIPCIGNIIFKHYGEAAKCGAAAVFFGVVVAVLVGKLVGPGGDPTQSEKNEATDPS
ncbi:MAG: Na+:solute symporter [Mariniblastus sp.]|nr:Na+:solute symporter [Mariniblastus sp.]